MGEASESGGLHPTLVELTIVLCATISQRHFAGFFLA